MNTLLVILIAWVVLSIPVALILARMFRSTRSEAGRREHGELSQGSPEFDSAPGEFPARPQTMGKDTHRVFPPR
ncbi:hypothetical protein ACIP5Y_05065 [Nocardia sp. NPDC088792]|uniref:hypothetical protein n=1 Tax=Nocardia sp. NPDC088792 TaxID=3364332 RepID=UPI0038176314